MNQLERRPDFKREVAAAHRVLEEVLAHALARVAHDSTTAPAPGRTSPTSCAPTPARARVSAASATLGVEGEHHAQAAVEDAHHLVGADRAAALDLEEDLRRLEAGEVDDRVQGARAVSAPRCRRCPPPVTWAAACTPAPKASSSVRTVGRVDDRRAQQLLAQAHAARRPRRARRATRRRPAAPGAPGSSRWSAAPGEARPEQDVARRARARGPARVRASTTPTAKPARSISSGSMTPACSAVSPPSSATPPGGSPRPRRRRPARGAPGPASPPRRSRARRAARRPRTPGRRPASPPGRRPPCRSARPAARPRAWCPRRRSRRPAPATGSARCPARRGPPKPPIDPTTPGRAVEATGRADARDRLVAGGDRDAGLRVGEAARGRVEEPAHQRPPARPRATGTGAG